MIRRPAFVCYTLSVLALAAMASPICRADAAADAKSILDESGIRAGFFIHLGAGDGSLTSALKQNDTIQVHGLERDASKVQTTRKQLRKSGVYGEVSVVHFDGNQLPYVDNLANLLVTEDLGDVSMDEVLRVLVPNGVAMVKGEDGNWSKTVKPRPDNIDEWSHYLHDASGNSVAQ